MPAVARTRSPVSFVLTTTVAVLVAALAPAAARADDGVTSGDVVVGELVQAWAEPENEDEAAGDVHDEPLSWVKTDTGDAVRVSTDDVADLPLGARVELSVGSEVVDAATTELGLEATREVLASEVLAPAPLEPASSGQTGTAVTNEVTVVMMVPSNGVQEPGRTLAQVVDAVQTSVRNFWSTETGGAVEVAVSAQWDWFQGTTDCTSPYGVWDEAAAHAGWVEGPGKHLLVYLPRDAPGCSYGLAEVGPSPSFGGRMYVTDVATSVIAHELGHNFGLGHSGARQCDGAVEAGNCTVDDYRDLYDVMGYSWGPVGSLSAAHAAALGVLPADQRATVSPTSPGQAYALSPLSGRSGIRGIQLTDARGVVYWLEYRTPTGRDAWLGGSENVPKLQRGVLLRRALGRNFTSLLDGSPSSSAGWSGDYQTALPVGVPVAVADDQLRITVQSLTDTAATVWIGTPAGLATGANRARPVGSLDGVSVDPWGSAISVRGWGLDADTPTDVLNVHLYVDGWGVALPASVNRPDVGQAFPGAGSAHGFTRTVPATPGSHRVCVYAIDSAQVGNTSLGCRTVTVSPRLPIGSLDAVSSAGETVTVRGWALDQDAPLDPLPVHLYIDGNGTAIRADGTRADVARVFPPAGGAHGFTFSTTLPGGSHTVCAYAIDSTGTGALALGCRTLAVVPYLPIGSLDEVSVSGSTVTVRGWTFDQDTPTTAIQAHVYIGRSGTPLTADGDRPDVGRVFPVAGAAHGFTLQQTLAPGDYRVCVYGIDSNGAGSTSLGCRTVTV